MSITIVVDIDIDIIESPFYTTSPGGSWHLQFDIETVDKREISTPLTSG